jgi:PAS domain S-box-containing protein
MTETRHNDIVSAGGDKAGIRPDSLSIGFGRVAWVAALAVIAIGVLDIIGTILNIALLTSVAPQWIKMRVITAVSFVLAGFSLALLLKRASDVRRYLALQAPPILVGLAGCLTIWLYAIRIITGQDLPLGHAPFFHLFWDVETRIALLTAVIFLLVGCGLAAMARGSRRAANIAHGIVLPAAIASYFVPVSYLLGVQDMHNVLGVPVAVNTGVAFCLLCAGIFCARMDTWLMSVFAAGGVGGYLARRLLPAILLIPVVMACVHEYSEQSGAFGPEVVPALMAVLSTMLLVWLIWLTAKSLNTRGVAARLQPDQGDSSEMSAGGTGKRRLVKYVYALLAVPLAILLRQALTPLLGPGVQYITIYAVTASVAVLGGLGPAVVTGLLGAILTDYLFVEPLYVFDINVPFISRTAVVVLTSAFVGYVGDMLRAARARAERQAESLRESEFKHRTVADNTYDWEFWLDPEGRFLYSSPSCLQITGYNHKEFESDPGLRRRLIHPDDRVAFENHVNDVEDRQVAGDGEWRFVRPDGSERWISHVCQPVFSEDGRYMGARCSVRDITARKQAEGALRESEEHLSAVVRTSPAGIFVTREADGLFLEANDAYLQLIGYRAEEVIGYTSLELNLWVDPEDRKKVVDTLRRHGHVENSEIQLRCKKGQIVDLLYSAKPFRQAGEQCILGTLTDITERKRAEEALRVASIRSQLLSETASRLLQSQKPQDIVNALCRKVMEHLDCHIFVNYLVDEAVNRLHLNASAGLPDQMTEAIQWLNFGEAICGRVAQEGHRIVAENIQESCDGRADLVRSVGIKAYACHPIMAPGRVLGTLSFGTRSRPGFTEDDLALMKIVTDQVAIAIERIRTQEALQRANEELEQRVQERTSELSAEVAERAKAEAAVKAERQRLFDVMETLPVYVILLTEDYHVPYANRFFRERFGESEGRRCYEYLFHRTEPCEICETYTILKTNRPHHWEWTGPDGRNYDIFDFPFLDSDGSRLIMEMGIDITEQKLAQKAMAGYLARQKLLLEVSERVMKQTNLDDLLNTVSDKTRELCGARYAATGHGYVNGNFITGGASRTPGAMPCLSGQVFSVEKGGVYMDLIEKQESIRLTDAQIRAHPAGWSLPPDHVPMRGLLGARLVNAIGEPNGILMVSNKEDGSDFTEEDEASLKELAAITSLALQHIEARTLAEQQAVEHEQASRYARSLLEASLDPLVTISTEGKITDVNEATIRVTGVAREELIGTDFSNYFTQPQNARDGYKQVFARGFVTDYPLTIRHRDGHLTDVLYNATVYRNTRGEITGVFAAARDITERKMAEAELEKYRLHLEDLVRQRTDDLTRSNKDLEQFAYVASHDLQEPLRAVAGFVELLKRSLSNSLESKTAGYMDFAVDGAKRMQLLINGLLEYSRVGQGEKYEKTSAQAALDTATANLRTPIEETGAQVVSDGLPTVHFDAIQLMQLFQNLIGNAIKFRGKEAPRIRIGVKRENESWQFAISDNGIGIEPEYADRIFLIFQRLHGRENYPGTGIGLAVCKKIVERHQGRIWVESKPGEGATFYFTIPDSSEGSLGPAAK